MCDMTKAGRDCRFLLDLVETSGMSVLIFLLLTFVRDCCGSAAVEFAAREVSVLTEASDICGADSKAVFAPMISSSSFRA